MRKFFLYLVTLVISVQVSAQVYTMLRKLLLTSSFLAFALQVSAQVTLNSTTGSTGYTGSNGCGTGAAGSCFITFAVQNTSASPIQITQVGQWTSTSNNGNTVDLYSSTTLLSGAPGGAFSTTTPPAGWSLAASGTISGITVTGVNNVLTGLNLIVPA